MSKFLLSFVLFFCLVLAVATPVSAASYMQGTARWNAVPGASYYNVYYKQTGEATYTHSVLNVSSGSTSYMINYLKPGIRYWYNVAAVNSAGQQISWGGLNKLRVSWMP